MVQDVCQVVSCANTNSGSVSLHLVPKNEELAERWLCFLEIANEHYEKWQPNVKMHVCSEHFPSNSFSLGPKGRKKIVGKATPTLLNEIDISETIGKRLLPLNSMDGSERRIINFKDNGLCIETLSNPAKVKVNLQALQACSSRHKQDQKKIAELESSIAEITNEKNLEILHLCAKIKSLEMDLLFNSMFRCKQNLGDFKTQFLLFRPVLELKLSEIPKGYKFLRKLQN